MKVTAVESILVEEFPNLTWVQVHTDEGLVGLIMEQLDLPDLAATARTCSTFATAAATFLRPLLKPSRDAKLPA